MLATVRRDGIEADGKSWSSVDEEKFKTPIRDQYERQGHPYYASARLWDDGVIDPADTRRVLGLAISASYNAPIEKVSTETKRFGVSGALLPVVIALELCAGLMIAIGWQTRIAAAALAIFCISAAFLFHADLADRNQLLHFEKDLAIAGGLLVLMVAGGGRWSIQGRAGG